MMGKGIQDCVHVEAFVQGSRVNCGVLCGDVHEITEQLRGEGLVCSPILLGGNSYLVTVTSVRGGKQ